MTVNGILCERIREENGEITVHNPVTRIECEIPGYPRTDALFQIMGNPSKYAGKPFRLFLDDPQGESRLLEERPNPYGANQFEIGVHFRYSVPIPISGEGYHSLTLKCGPDFLCSVPFLVEALP